MSYNEKAKENKVSALLFSSGVENWTDFFDSGARRLWLLWSNKYIVLRILISLILMHDHLIVGDMVWNMVAVLIKYLKPSEEMLEFSEQQ